MGIKSVSKDAVQSTSDIQNPSQNSPLSPIARIIEAVKSELDAQSILNSTQKSATTSSTDPISNIIQNVKNLINSSQSTQDSMQPDTIDQLVKDIRSALETRSTESDPVQQIIKDIKSALKSDSNNSKTDPITNLIQEIKTAFDTQTNTVTSASGSSSSKLNT